MNANEYWDSAYDCLLKLRTNKMNEYNRLVERLNRLQAEITKVNNSLDKMLELGKELGTIN